MNWLIVVEVPPANGREGETIKVQVEERYPSRAMAHLARLGLEPEGPCIVHIQPVEETAA
jgi:hypothetical protein